MDALRALDSHGLRYELIGFSALDRYFKNDRFDNLYVSVDGSLIDLAKALGELEYPGLELWDAMLPNGEGGIYFACAEDRDVGNRHSFRLLSLRYDPARGAYRDPFDSYDELRGSYLQAIPDAVPAIRTIGDAAVLAARYNFKVDRGTLPGLDGVYDLPVDYERKLLVDIVTGTYAWRGLALLMECGFVERYWPELLPMNTTDHTKEFHPEGNVWTHSLETLKYRKTHDPLLSMALLLHDSGKPYAERTKSRAFSDHAGIGAKIAEDFVGRLGFSQHFRDSVAWLVKQHMLPGLLHKLPVHRTRMAMRNSLFPVLLELFRCDLSATYEGPDNYYRACKTYRRFLKNDSNPFRGADGKKLLQLYVE